MSIQAFIFDMDDTLINSPAGIAQATNHVLGRSGFSTHREEDFFHPERPDRD